MEENTYDKIVNELVEMLKANHNIILTGAPGTGKTYLAREIAKELLEIKRDNSEDSDKELDSCSRFGFVQFHPSYDYTDFVEGLRPTTGDNGFKLENGIFKKFCINALRDKSTQKTSFELSNEKLLKHIYDKFIKENSGNVFELEKEPFQVVDDNKIQFAKEESEFGSYKIEKKKWSFEDFNKLFKQRPNQEKIEPDDIKNIIGNFKMDNKGGCIVFNELLKRYKAAEEEQRKVQKSYFVFVIDEINRGEISKIFGELFFTIDPGYKGTRGAVQTQYANMQNEPNEFDKVLNNGKHGQFFVPADVYIIGTMNDIDRSVESMDFAMRRRFAWREITAKESETILDNNDILKDAPIDRIKKRMKNLNDAIIGEYEYTEGGKKKIQGLNKSFQIGASYFLKYSKYKKNDKPFEKLWEYHLRGLLYEYLRGNANPEEDLELLKQAYDDDQEHNKDQGQQ